jgi:hypothetical protein
MNGNDEGAVSANYPTFERVLITEKVSACAWGLPTKFASSSLPCLARLFDPRFDVLENTLADFSRHITPSCRGKLLSPLLSCICQQWGQVCCRAGTGMTYHPKTLLEVLLNQTVIPPVSASSVPKGSRTRDESLRGVTSTKAPQDYWRWCVRERMQRGR